MSFANLFVAAGRAVAERRRRHADYAELMALDDRTLADIGIHRSEIAGIVYGEPSDLAPTDRRNHSPRGEAARRSAGGARYPDPEGPARTRLSTRLDHPSTT
jgi:uncharacterized protein YjiS (DUF1127 family)